MISERPDRARLSLVQYWAVVRKEAIQTLRDRRIMFMLIMAPLIQTILFGFAVDFDVDEVRTVVADMDRSAGSREQIRRLLADRTLLRSSDAPGSEEADRLVHQEDSVVALAVPPGFGNDLAAGRTARVQAIVDGTNPLRAGAATSAVGRYFGWIAQRTARERLEAAGVSGLPEIEVVPRIFYNRSLGTAIYMVPGILAMLLVVVTTIVTAMGLAREREAGTLEQVLVTPVSPFVLLAGKMTPFVVIGLFDVLLSLTAMAWTFDVPIRGPLLVLALGSLFYLCSTLGAGLFISTISSTQQQAFMGGFLFAIPAAILSGIMTPIHAMPVWLRAATYLNPLRFYAELVRGVLLRGSDALDQWSQLAILAAFGTAIMLLATLQFRRRLG